MNGRVLLVDDDPHILRGFARSFPKSDWAFDCAENSDRAVSYVGRNAYDVIIVDYMLPDDDGIELIHRLRMKAPDASFVLASGHCDVQTTARAVNAGEVSFVLPKPWSAREMLEILDAAQLRRQVAAPPPMARTRGLAERLSRWLLPAALAMAVVATVAVELGRQASHARSEAAALALLQPAARTPNDAEATRSLHELAPIAREQLPGLAFVVVVRGDEAVAAELDRRVVQASPALDDLAAGRILARQTEGSGAAIDVVKTRVLDTTLVLGVDPRAARITHRRWLGGMGGAIFFLSTLTLLGIASRRRAGR